MTEKDLTADKIQPDPQENIENDVETSANREKKIQEPTPEESVVKEVTEDTITVEEKTGTATEEVVAETTAEEVVAETSTEELVAETPTEEVVAETITEEEVAETATEEVVAETVPEEVVAETASEEVVAETTAEEVVAETAAEEVVAETAAEEVVAETAAEEVVAETATEEVVAETASEEVVAETTAEEVVVEPGAPVAQEAVKDETTASAEENVKPLAEKSKGKGKQSKIHEDAALLEEINDMDEDATESDIDEEDEEGAEQEEIVEKYDTYDREKLVEILEETVKEENILKIKTRVAMIKVAFLRLSKENRQQLLEAHINEGGTRDNYTPAQDPLVEKFNQVFETYKRNKIKFNEHQEVVKLRNLDAKKEILEQLKELINSEETLKKTYDEFKDLQQKWKEIGLVPSTEINNLWQNYHFLVEKFFDKVKISKELRDLDLKKNLERKLELCEKAEELLIEPSAIKSFQQLQKYHEEWKEIGPVPQDKRDELWERFKTATDKINERRRDHYNSLAKDQDENLAAKTALIEKAEQIASMEIDNLKEWQEKTREVNELFRVWKTIGPAPKKENDEIWARFKTFLNAFFANKKEYFSKIKQEQLNNFNLKLDIVKQAEALKDSTDWRKTTQELINLQKEWKEIGPVPRKHSDKIWKRFRAVCDEFFQNKAKFFSTVVESEKENLDKKLNLITRIESWVAGSDKSANLEALKGFQREFTEIGHVPIKEKNKIHDAFRQAINKHFDELKISSFEVRPAAEYRQRHESSYHDQSSGRHQQRRGGGNDWGPLSSKVSKLREEILTWENNIGFLAHSKKADLLKQEFEKKIEDAKKELAEYEAQLKNMQE